MDNNFGCRGLKTSFFRIYVRVETPRKLTLQLITAFSMMDFVAFVQNSEILRTDENKAVKDNFLMHTHECMYIYIIYI